MKLKLLILFIILILFVSCESYIGKVTRIIPASNCRVLITLDNGAEFETVIDERIEVGYSAYYTPFCYNFKKEK